MWHGIINVKVFTPYIFRLCNCKAFYVHLIAIDFIAQRQFRNTVLQENLVGIMFDKSGWINILTKKFNK